MKKTPNGSSRKRAGTLSTSTNSKTSNTVQSNGHSTVENEKIKPKNHNGSLAYADVENESSQMQRLLQVLDQVRNGDFSVRIPAGGAGIHSKVGDTLNDIISLNEILFHELKKAGNIIGRQGHLNHRVELPRYARGAWNEGVESINTLISDLVHPSIEIANVISSVAKGNLSHEMPLKIGDHVLQGEFGRIAVKQYATLRILGSGNAIICGTRRETEPLIRRGWVSFRTFDKHGYSFVRITPDGLRALALAVERYGLPELARVERVAA